jgi:predicted polyphosphate/ATP-dependent NAD kinase
MSQETLPTKTIGFIINPIAGMGGAVGLKGTDGQDTLAKAVALGAKPIAAARAEIFLKQILPAKEKLHLLVGAGNMGEDEVAKLGFNYQVVGEKKAQTSSQDTQNTAKQLLDAKVDLLVFCGGDGTTRDIQKIVDLKLPVLGMPTGVKMHSAVFAVSPQAAARVALRYLWANLPLKESEVMDVDEQAFRSGRLSAELYGYVLTPFEPTLIQGNKLASPMTEDELRNQAAIAVYIIEEMKPDIIYVLGPGTTTRTITDLLDQKKTLLGVDIMVDKKLVAKDVNENQILEYTAGKPAFLIVTPIGGQGFIFGRGNQQLSSIVIRQIGLDNIIVIASKSKLEHLQSLKIDTGDLTLDEIFKSRKQHVITDYKTVQEVPVE